MALVVPFATLVAAPQAMERDAAATNVMTPEMFRDIHQKVNLTVTNVVAQIYKDIASQMKKHQDMLKKKQDPDQAVAGGKKFAEDFISEYASNKKLDEIEKFKKEYPLGQLLLATVANRAAAASLSSDSPIRNFLGMVGALTNQQNLINFFMVESLGPTKDLMKDLKNTYSEDAVNQAVQDGNNNYNTSNYNNGYNNSNYNSGYYNNNGYNNSNYNNDYYNNNNMRYRY